MLGYLILLLLLGSNASLISDVGAAERTQPIRIGALTDSWGPTPGVVGLSDGLKELGYRENQDFAIGVRFTQGNIAALPAAARDLLAQGVDILFTTTPVSVKAARTATSTIPIVFTGAGDPLGQGLIQSFARPGRNLTGITDLDLQLDPKRLEVFHEMIPGFKRALYPYDPSDDFSGAQAKGYRDAAHRLKIVLVEKPVRTPDEAQATFAAIRKSEVDGIVTPRSLSSNIPGLAMEATSRQGIPTMFPVPWFVERGGLVSYGSDLYQSGRMAARLVDKILKGESAAKIPVEVNQKVELVINLKVAKAVGIKIASEVLYRANRVIQ